VLAVLALGLGLRLAIAMAVPVLEAESYYWTWSRQLAWGYFDHPPAVALLIKAGTLVFGDGGLGLRAGHLILGTLASLMFWRFCRRHVGPRASLGALALASIAPFWMPFGVAATPDGPMLACWVASLLAFWSALQGQRTAPWLLTGLLVGLTTLSKYNGGQLPPVFVLFMLATPRGRAWLRRPGPWLALLLAGLVLLPNVLWNLDHNATTVGMPFKSGFEPEQAGLNLLKLGALPFLLMTPLVAWAWLRESLAWWRSPERWSDERRLLLIVGSWAPMLAFLAVSILTEVHAHWAASVFVCATPLALRNLDGGSATGPSPAWLRRSLALGLGWMLTLALAVVLLPTLAGSDWKLARRAALELSGWDELTERIDELRERPDAPLLVSMNFHLVSRMEWLSGGELMGLPLRLDHRHQYRWWLGPELLGRDGLYVTKAKPDKPVAGIAETLERWFERTEPLPPIMVELGGEPVRRFELVWCEGLRTLE